MVSQGYSHLTFCGFAIIEQIGFITHIRSLSSAHTVLRTRTEASKCRDSITYVNVHINTSPSNYFPSHPGVNRFAGYLQLVSR